MNLIINEVLILFLVLNQSCSSKTKVDFDKNLQQTQCEEADKNTEKWRCAEVVPVSQSIRKVARCFSNRGTKENFDKALNTLEAVANSGAFYSCLPTEELNAFTQDLTEYRNEAAKNK
jgi:hypothetical protein